jgi:hypothetical protein
VLREAKEPRQESSQSTGVYRRFCFVSFPRSRACRFSLAAAALQPMALPAVKSAAEGSAESALRFASAPTNQFRFVLSSHLSEQPPS